jgi:hypothetical protein
MNKKRFLWLIFGISVVLTLVWPNIPLKSASARLHSIPSSGPDFRTRRVQISTADRRLLGDAEATQYLITTKSGSRLLLTLIDGTNNRHAVHDPIYCFVGNGWQIQRRETVPIPLGHATWLSLANQQHRSDVMWFFDNGKKQFESPVEYWFQSALRRLTLGKSGDESILVSLRSLPNEPVDWDRVREIMLPALGFH